MQAYSDPSRENDPHALPDLDVFFMSARNIAAVFEDNGGHETEYTEPGWYYCYALPGCLPDSEAFGPFATEAEALADARDNAEGVARHGTCPIAYTYEADTHCPECAEARFGTCEEHGQTACCVTDSEGNEPGAVFSWTEWQHGEPEHARETLACGTCHSIIDETEPDTGAILAGYIEAIESGDVQRVPEFAELRDTYSLTPGEIYAIADTVLTRLIEGDIILPEPEHLRIDWNARLADWNRAVQDDNACATP